jgi:hypothetical protein
MDKSQAPSESNNKTEDFFCGWMDGIEGEEEGMRNYLCCAYWSGFVVFRHFLKTLFSTFIYLYKDHGGSVLVNNKFRC